MIQRALFRIGFWLPWALPLAFFTVAAAQPLACYLTWGSIHVPLGATRSELAEALFMDLAAFLLLLAVPKLMIYFGGTSIRTWKDALTAIGLYLVLPVIVWVVFFFTPMMTYGWTLIALTAWLEALQNVFGPRLSERYRKAFRLD